MNFVFCISFYIREKYHSGFIMINNLISHCIPSRPFREDTNMINCLFKDISSSSHGSVIYSSNSNFLNFNDTTFYNCSSALDGGVIWFQGGLKIQLFSICVIGCRAGDFL